MRQLASALVVFCCGWAHAQNLSIESTDLRVPPAEAIVLISKSQAIYENHEFPQCTLAGRPIFANKLWAITATGCPVGNNAGPIWIVLHDSNGTRIVHEQNYYSIEVLKTGSHGLPDLTWTSSTAAFYVGGTLRYDGREYVSSPSRIVNLNNPAECQANRDVCVRPMQK